MLLLHATPALSERWRRQGIVTGWQQAAVSKIAETVGLTPKEYADEFTGGLGGLGSLEILSYEGPGAPNVAWCSGLTLSGGAVSRGGVTAFCGPLTDVPHLVELRRLRRRRRPVH